MGAWGGCGWEGKKVGFPFVKGKKLGRRGEMEEHVNELYVKTTSVFVAKSFKICYDSKLGLYKGRQLEHMPAAVMILKAPGGLSYKLQKQYSSPLYKLTTTMVPGRKLSWAWSLLGNVYFGGIHFETIPFYWNLVRFLLSGLRRGSCCFNTVGFDFDFCNRQKVAGSLSVFFFRIPLLKA